MGQKQKEQDKLQQIQFKIKVTTSTAVTTPGLKVLSGGIRQDEVDHVLQPKAPSSETPQYQRQPNHPQTRFGKQKQQTNSGKWLDCSTRIGSDGTSTICVA